jgi:tetratricopeptide (TPR) repeat protein
MKRYCSRRENESANFIRSSLLIVALVCLIVGNVSAKEIVQETGRQVIQTASLGNDSVSPRVNDSNDISEREQGNNLSAKACNERGIAYAEKGQYDLAISEFTKAVGIDPSSAETYNNRGIAYSKKGRYNLAISDFTRALSLNHDGARAYYNRGITYALMGRADLALSDFNSAATLKPGDSATYDVMGSVHAELACSEWKRACDLGNCEHLAKAVQQGMCTRATGNEPSAQ